MANREISKLLLGTCFRTSTCSVIKIHPWKGGTICPTLQIRKITFAWECYKADRWVAKPIFELASMILKFQFFVTISCHMRNKTLVTPFYLLVGSTGYLCSNVFIQEVGLDWSISWETVGKVLFIMKSTLKRRDAGRYYTLLACNKLALKTLHPKMFGLEVDTFSMFLLI